MEFSCYHFHSNRKSGIYIFIKNHDEFLIKIITIYDVDEEYEEIQFLISDIELRSHEFLYQKYILSVLMTMDTNNLVETKDNRWGVMCKKNWKGLYFTKNYEISYTLDKKPVFEKPDNSEKVFENYIKGIYKDRDMFERIVYQNKVAFQRIADTI